MIQIFFLIRDLERGGAQRQLVELVKGLDKRRFTITVATFYDGGAFRPELAELPGVRLVSLQKQGRWDLLRFTWRLLRHARATRPQIVHGYMGVANELGLLAGRFAGARVVWGLRASNMERGQYGRVAGLADIVGARLARFADLVIVNSHAGKRHHQAHGYSRARMVVIENGIDTAQFRPDPEARRQTRAGWGVAAHEPLVGLAARLDPMKDHATFLQAAALIRAARPDARFVCVGDGPAQYRQELHMQAERLGLAERLIWAGAWGAMPAAYNAFDVAVSSSLYGEGFANALGEAMACGVPCVATDVGDAALIVGDAGAVVPARRPEALAQAVLNVLALSPERRAELAQQCRERISDCYSAAHLVERTQAVLLGLL